jgi:hypothetical protein
MTWPEDPAAWRVLTVRQPWAWAITHGTKATENRAQGALRWKWRGPLMIHAGSSWSDRGAGDERVLSCWVQGATEGLVGPLERPRRVAGQLVHESMRSARPADRIVLGAVTAVADLADVPPAAGCCLPWGEDWYPPANSEQRSPGQVAHLVLEERTALPDDGVPATGRLGLWKPDADLVGDVLVALELVAA